MADRIGSDRWLLRPWSGEDDNGSMRLHLRLIGIQTAGQNRLKTGVHSLQKMSFIGLPEESRQWLLANSRIDIDVQPCCTGILDVRQMLSRDRVSTVQAKTYDENGFSHICAAAAAAGHIDCLRMAYESGIGWDVSCTATAAAAGNIECLRFAHENGCAWDENTCKSAAAGGQLECLRYLKENGCPWDAKTCAEATRYGHLDCLKYAYENGCRWDHETVVNALNYDHRSCLLYAMSQGER